MPRPAMPRPTMPRPMMPPPPPSVAGLLAAAVDGIGGTDRPGQDAMAEAVWHAIGTGEHLAVQAGTGTGKSLAYLVPRSRTPSAGAHRWSWRRPRSPFSAS